MPYCLQPGCPEKVSRGRCVEHAKPLQAQHGRFKSGSTNYSSSKWIRLRDRFRTEHPLCAHAAKHADCTLTTDVVDHIVPHRGDEHLMYDEANLQPLCYHCHGVKTAEEVKLGHTQ